MMTDKERFEELAYNGGMSHRMLVFAKKIVSEMKDFYQVNEPIKVEKSDIETIEWLIEQAEKAEYYEMKYENTGAIFNRRHMLDKIERYENAIKECVERMNEGGAGTRSFVYEKLIEVLGEDKE